jgi:thiamine biosynthesis lipoprotein
MTTSTSQDWILVQRFQRLMATPMGIHLAVPPGQEARADEAIAGCFAWFEQVGERLTRFTTESELSRLNAAGGEWCTVSDLLYAVVEESLAAAQATDGLFDPALLAVLEGLGYDRDFREIARREVASQVAAQDSAVAVRGGPVAMPAQRWREIELDRARSRSRLPAGVRLDLGGIVKGWVADRALDRYFADLPNVLIDAGGDIRARGGARPGEPWAIGIGDPFTGADEQTIRDVAVLTLGCGGLATSGATMRWWYHGGERQHHLIDPRTGRPADLWIGDEQERPADGPLIASATALASTAAHAEVAAKVALLRGYPDALRTVELAWQAWNDSDASAPGEQSGYGDDGVALILVLGSGEVVCSAHLQEYLQALGGGGDVYGWADHGGGGHQAGHRDRAARPVDPCDPERAGR